MTTPISLPQQCPDVALSVHAPKQRLRYLINGGSPIGFVAPKQENGVVLEQREGRGFHRRKGSLSLPNSQSEVTHSARRRAFTPPTDFPVIGEIGPGYINYRQNG